MAAQQISSHNPEGYADPTAHDALEPVQREQLEADQRLARLIKTLKNTIDLAGYDLLIKGGRRPTRRLQIEDLRRRTRDTAVRPWGGRITV